MAVAMLCSVLQNLFSILISVVVKSIVPFSTLVKRSTILIYGLLAKLIKRNAPVHFIRILQSWYSVFRCSVIWNSLIGKPFDVICGVKQGGILSPFLFSVYVDDLLAELRKSGPAFDGT